VIASETQASKVSTAFVKGAAVGSKRYAGSKMKAYYFEDKRSGKKRNTAVFATSAESAKDKLTRPPAEHARVYAVRTPEKGEGAGGRWSRIRADGKSPSKSSLGKGRGFGPPR
jgi:hypothetical protein